MSDMWGCPMCSKPIKYGKNCPLATADNPDGWIECDNEFNVNGKMIKKMILDGKQLSNKDGLGISEIANKDES